MHSILFIQIMKSTALLFFLLLNQILFLDANAESVAAAAAAVDQKISINCGSSIKIRHKESGYFLFSDAFQFAQGSQQQIVTFAKDAMKVYWTIQDGFGNSTSSSCVTGKPIRCGDTIRLLHTSTKKRLHSHDFQSMLTPRNHQVSAFGDTGPYGVTGGDDGDDWVVQCKNRLWFEGDVFQLVHKTTNKFLTSATSRQYTNANCPMCPIIGQLEASATNERNQLNYLVVEGGVHVVV